MSAKPKSFRFMATLYRIWMMRHIDVPEEVARVLQRQMAKSRAAGKAVKPKYIPVVATVNRASARTTLVPAGGGRFRMQVNTALRKAARVDTGEVVSVELRIDRESRTLPVPPDLREGLKQHPKAQEAFEALAPGHRRQFIQWVDSAKSEEARTRRLNRAIDVLLERAMLGTALRRRRRG
ncbi:MAG TPA: YdeI/OmpD-associated family protein [Candidatus Acidoferrales bacterium]|nr:YdeI/OmpD-associated family protein [Candidatus Acidoferrales bacterium]